MGGYNTYSYSYRSYIDTPIAQKAVYQHYANGMASVNIAGLPLSVTYLLSSSNAFAYTNIHDVNVSIDVNTLKNNLASNTGSYIKQRLNQIADSLKLPDVNNLKARLVNPFAILKSAKIQQLLSEYKEVLSVPELAGSSGNNSKAGEDSLIKKAQAFITKYDSLIILSAKYQKQYDSLYKIYTAAFDKILALQQLLTQNISTPAELKLLNDKLLQMGLSSITPPIFTEKLNAIRKFSVGRSRLDYSELTGKNIYLKGVNFEYNSPKIYFSLAAGGVDFRYRDFRLSSSSRQPQYMFMIRAGRGKIENTHIHFTFFKGRKQLIPSYAGNLNSNISPISGISVETKYVLKNSEIVLEGAQSVSPDFRVTPVQNSKFSLSDDKNLAYSIKAKTFMPRLRMKVEGFYRYTGANFQSFSSYQTVNSNKSWLIKAEKYFFKNTLRISGQVKENNFTNPYILQQYNSNTIFKSAQVFFRKKKLPSVSASYMPVTQLLKIGNDFYENQFNTLNISLTHRFKLNAIYTNTSILYSRFYNDVRDSSFSFYNATNIFASQFFNFKLFSSGITVTHTKSSDYTLNVISGELTVPVKNITTFNFGIRVNNFNSTESVVGTYGNVQFDIKKIGSFNASYDVGYLPTLNRQFVKNSFYNISFTQTF